MADKTDDADLRDAVKQFKKDCGEDPEYKRVVDRLDDAIRELDDVSDDDEDDRPRQKQPDNLKDAAKEARGRFQKARGDKPDRDD